MTWISIGRTIFITAIFAIVSGQLKWTQQHNGQSAAPIPRRDPGLGYYADKNLLVLFGGMDSNRTHLDDTWIYSIDNGTWREVSSTVRPKARRSFVYGSKAGRFYIATGEGKPLLSDVWQFDFNSETWEALPQMACGSNPIIPQPRYGAAGGLHPDSDELFVSLGFGDVRYFDTFSYDLINKCWKAVTSEDSSVYNPTYPHARCLHGGAMTGRDELVIFGGCLGGGGVAGPCPIGDTWLLSKNANGDMVWADMQYCPVPRIYTNMAKLPSPSRRAVLYGGIEKSKQVITTSEIPANEVAIFDPVKLTWTIKQTQETDSPPKRASTAMITANNGIYMFGGLSSESGKPLNDLWLLAGDEDSTTTTDTCNRLFFNYIMVHGLLMFLGWGVFLQLGAFIARYLKGSGSTWFRFHFILQSLGLILSLVGFVYAILSVDGFKTHFSLAHSIIGLIIMIVGCLQPVNAVFRPHVEEVKTTKRKVWEFFHKNLGRLVLILATVNITLGMFVGVVARSIWVAWLVYWAVLIAVYLIAEIFKIKQNKKQKM